jgi:hypothetical protein
LSKIIWSPRNTYLYLVCLITLIIVIFSTVNLVKAVVELLYPEPQTSLAVQYPVAPRSIEGPPEIDQKQLEEQRDMQRKWALRRAVLSLVGSAAMFLIAGPLYVYHWRKIESAARGDTSHPGSS